MRLKSLRLHRLPGFKFRGFSLGEEHLGGAVNIVVGPNASGKTSVCQAIRKLLWPELVSLSPAWIESAWEWQGREISLTIEGNTRLGNDVLIQRLPDMRLATCFSIAIDDLFNAEDPLFAQKISEAMSGGYSLEEALRKVAPGSGAKGEVMAWKESQQQVRKYELEQRALRHREESIPRLEAELQEAQQCKQALDWIVKYQQVEKEYRELLEAFSSWQSIELPAEQLLQRQSGRLDRICSLSSQLQQFEQELHQKQSAVETRSRLLGVAPDAVVSLRADELWGLQQLWQTCEVMKSRAAGLERQLQWLVESNGSSAREVGQDVEIIHQILAQRTLLLPSVVFVVGELYWVHTPWFCAVVLWSLWREWSLRARSHNYLGWSRAQLLLKLEEKLAIWGEAQQVEACANQRRELAQALAQEKKSIEEGAVELQAKMARAGIVALPESMPLFAMHLRDLHSDWVALQQVCSKKEELKHLYAQELLEWKAFAAVWGEEEPVRGAFERIQRRVEGVRALQKKGVELVALQQQMGSVPEEAAQKAERVEGIQKELAELRAEIRHAERTLQGQTLRNTLRDRFAAVREAARQVARKELSEFLLVKVQQVYRRDYQPGVVQRAAQWFQQFTMNQFTLTAGGAVFEAIEASTGERKAIGELSRGTRMQLLLAVRLAFALEQEPGGIRMPLFLDEVLANTDPERFDSVVRVFAELAKEGRQIFYFTCNPEDAWRWRAVCPEARLIDLRELQLKEAFLKAPREQEESPRWPKPKEGQGLREYVAELQLPGLRWEEPVEMASIHHVAGSSLELYGMLSGGISVVGHWKQIDLGAWGNVVDAERISQRARILERYLALKKQGRGRRLTKEALVQGGISSAFVDRMWEVVQGCDCDTRQFLRVLEAREDDRVKRFQKKAVEAFRDFCVSEGYFDEREILDEESIRRELYPSVLKNLSEQEIMNNFLYMF